MGMIAHLGYSLAPTGTIYTAFTAFVSLSAMTTPAVRSLLSKLVDSSSHGRLFSSILLFDSIVLLFFSVGINTLYQLTVGSFPGAVYMSMSVLLFVALLVSFGGVNAAGDSMSANETDPLLTE
ncbi:UNVERIFIED_CONTAM: hypothetical protein HDU68_008393 [Siphonaria sp. JEL0065]|nr:hypothetical protein HDU68_008393 [Siphonaria sp. JEL0065]